VALLRPRRLSISKISPNYNREAINAIDKVLVDGVLIQDCVAFDMDAGWAFGKDANKSWLPRVHGTVKVTYKGGL
jgi:hypothetical protein